MGTRPRPGNRKQCQNGEQSGKRKGWKGEGGREETQKAKARSQWDRGRERQQRQGKETEGRKKETKRGRRRQREEERDKERKKETKRGIRRMKRMRHREKKEWGEGDNKEEGTQRQGKGNSVESRPRPEARKQCQGVEEYAKRERPEGKRKRGNKKK
jgi:hypothetical protein